ncbi:MAG: nuclear transport factor 2 family protein [Candidatus Aquilonibacter sp.]
MTLPELIEELVGAWQANDAHRAAAFFALDGVYHESGSEPIVGREAIFAHFARFFHEGPAWRFEIDEIIVEGERAAVGYRFGVNRGGTWHTSGGCALVHGKHSLIARWREYRG